MSINIEATYVQENEFDQLITNNDLVVVDYTAVWCGPCRVVAPLMDRLATEYQGKAAVVKVDLDKSPDNAKKYGVRSIPTVLIFKNGEVAETLVGKASYEIFSNAVEKQLKL
ncbi:Thioredoxin 1 [Hyella patelloides LEGE 07179]|uniref:Thioredoxin n=1 Tax=Hyella patelloides LEGE 07179 TaxID=945734 RepID=A0A563VJF4_9CYAN|nr:thioredoxin [Hyella patelloides]VEP11542.1 Thioredoxin 1 [Hyella patelloides LEGE 07179]